MPRRSPVFRSFLSGIALAVVIVGGFLLIRERVSVRSGWSETPISNPPARLTLGRLGPSEPWSQWQAAQQISAKPSNDDSIRRRGRVDSTDVPELGELITRLRFLVDDRGLDGAIAVLDRGLAGHLEAGGPRTTKDYAFALAARAALLLERARLSKAPSIDQASALNDALRASELATDEPFVWFNLALAKEGFWLLEAAIEAWDRYLLIENDSDWQREAESHRERVIRQLGERSLEERRVSIKAAAMSGDEVQLDVLVSMNRGLARIAGEEKLKKWAEGWIEGDEESAAAALDQLRLIAASLVRHQGDSLLADTLADFDEAIRTGDSVHVARHVQALATYLRTTNYDERARTFGPLSEIRSPFAIWARFYTGVAVYYDQPGQATAIFDQLLAEVDQQQYPALAGRCEHMKGLIAANLGELTQSIEHYRRAVQILEAGGEIGLGLYSEAMIADSLMLLGEESQAVERWIDALAARHRFGDKVREHGLLDTVAEWLSHRGFSYAALEIREILVALSADGEPRDAAHAYTKRARSFAEVGRVDDARTDLAAASGLYEEMVEADNDAAPWIQIDIELTRAGIEPDPQSAFEHLSRVIEQVDDDGREFLLPPLMTLRAEKAAELGRLETAGDDLRRAQTLIEKQLDRIQDFVPAHRASFVQRYEETIRLYVERLALEGRPAWEGFEANERRKGRGLYPLQLAAGLAESARRSLDLQPKSENEIRSFLADNEALISFLVGDESSFAWILTRDSLEQVRLPDVRRGDLRETVETLLAAIDGDHREKVDTQSETLYRSVVEPLLAQLVDSPRWIIVGDGSLTHVPFGYLRDRRSGTDPSEQDTVLYAPSASSFVAARERALQQEGEPIRTAVTFGNSLFNAELYPRLRRLHFVEEEALEVKSHFEAGSSYLGLDSTETRFIEAVPKGGLLHIASHAAPTPGSPLKTALLFAPDAESDGRLTAKEISYLDLSGVRLAVLSACSTSGNIEARNLQGAETLARAFLAAGVPTVLASLWDVDDASSHRFMSTFYGYFSDHGDAVTALRQAQIDAQDRGEPLRAWAGYQVLGAGRS